MMGNLYGDHPDIEFVNTFEGHADYYEGDDATGEPLEEWLGPTATTSSLRIFQARQGRPQMGHRLR